MASSQRTAKRLTIREVAQALGVSTATVSRALHGRGRINPATRTRILAQLERMGYTPNLHAQSLAGKRSSVVALEYLGNVDVLADSFLIELARGIQHSLASYHYRLLLNLTGDCEYRRGVLHQWIAGRAIDGVIVVANPCVDTAWMHALSAEGVPTVWIAYDVPHPLPPHTGVVQLNLSAGWREAIEHLNALGHRQFGLIAVDPNDPALEVIQQAIHSVNGQLAHTVFACDDTPSGGYRATLDLLERKPFPSALLARTDLLAFGVAQALHRYGIRLPHDVSLVGHDDLPLTQWMIPPLSSIRIDYLELGQRAVAMLMQLIEQRAPSVAPVCVATRLVVRDSVAPPRPNPKKEVDP
ncbi:MAG: hypothetical protein CFK48_05130 [Armatimonadetes bacterium CP1_7O]|nr:MAG: hypothetical protein CFK48_05130 [Armatimonadetes bacterium CP1_7O]